MKLVNPQLPSHRSRRGLTIPCDHDHFNSLLAQAGQRLGRWSLDGVGNLQQRHGASVHGDLNHRAA